MRKLLLCVPMMILLLSACGGRVGVSEAEKLSLEIRGEYLAMTSCAANAAITADYGQRVYQYELTVSVNGEETVLVLSAPETVAGITARLNGTDGLLEYDGMSVETGALDGDGLNPVSAIPALLSSAKSGYISACAIEETDGERLLLVECSDPEGEYGTGVETSLWFHADTHALVKGEITVDGFRVILCEFSDFTKG